MPGINPAVAQHTIPLVPGAKPIIQKRRQMAAERQKFVQEEIDKLKKNKFIRVAKYAKWASNVVVVPKANGKLRMCVDYTDLNKVSPKDSFPLPKIDNLVKEASGNELMSFMDAFSGYHQISMAPEDEEKTTFCTDRGSYCYTRMPFGLINAGATYQRMMNKVFKNQIGRNLSVYVDDMMVQTKVAIDHIQDLRETFETMRKFQLRLNPEKCMFGVTRGKFLGYIVTKHGVEANPSKIQAIIEMSPPKSTKEVSSLTGKMVSLSRFISNYTERCLPFFKALKAKDKFEWTQECQKAFEELKHYLTSPPLLAQPQPHEPLYLYVAVSEQTIASVLTRVDGQSLKQIM